MIQVFAYVSSAVYATDVKTAINVAKGFFFVTHQKWCSVRRTVDLSSGPVFLCDMPCSFGMKRFPEVVYDA
jgi:3-deoxy-D-manno-octulosonic acid (KDO) 8-phosphate synthase